MLFELHTMIVFDIDRYRVLNILDYCLLVLGTFVIIAMCCPSRQSFYRLFWSEIWLYICHFGLTKCVLYAFSQENIDIFICTYKESTTFHNFESYFGNRQKTSELRTLSQQKLMWSLLVEDLSEQVLFTT